MIIHLNQIENIVSLAEAREEVTFKLLISGYLSSGYKLENVRLVKAIDDYFSVKQTSVIL